MIPLIFLEWTPFRQILSSMRTLLSFLPAVPTILLAQTVWRMSGILLGTRHQATCLGLMQVLLEPIPSLERVSTVLALTLLVVAALLLAWMQSWENIWRMWV